MYASENCIGVLALSVYSMEDANVYNKDQEPYSRTSYNIS